MTPHCPTIASRGQGPRRATMTAAGAAGLAVLAVVAALSLTVGGAAAGGPGPAVPLIEWSPSESYPWGSQYDSRLDRPIRIWRTAVPLVEVSAEIERQTGIQVGLWSLDDSSRELGRMRLNLYLNPRDPPSLRSLLAQLSWVLGFAIAYRPAGNGDSIRYDLLCSDPGPAGLGALSGMMEAYWEAQRDRVDSYRRRREARLEQYHDALALSPADLSARYRNVDDTLLFDLTDAAHRAVVHFFLGLPRERIQAFLREGRVLVQWDSLNQSQRSLLDQAFPVRAAPVAEVEVQDGGDGSPMVSLTRAPETPAPPGAEERGWGLRVAPSVQLGRPWDRLAPDEAIARARTLGEVITPADEATFRQEFARRKAQAETRAEATYRAKRRGEAEARQRDREALSAQMEDRLSAIVVPTGTEPGRLRLSEAGGALWTLWEVQQAVAAAANVNVVSDCFWQPRRPLLHPGLSENEACQHTPPPQQVTALLTLQGASFGGVDPLGDDLSRAPLSRWPTRPAWEWGDAGTFLRFRSTERALWRASLLPVDVVVRLDRIVELDTARSATEGETAAPFDLRQLAALAGKLSDVQLLFGARMVYGDPMAEEEETARQVFRNAALMPEGGEGSPGRVMQYLGRVRLLSGLTEKQWEQAAAAGLVVGRDLSPDQQSALRFLLSGEWAPEWARKSQAAVQDPDLKRLPECVLKLAGPTPGRDGLFRIRLVLAGKGVYDWQYDQPVPRPIRPTPGRLSAVPSGAGRAGP